MADHLIFGNGVAEPLARTGALDKLIAGSRKVVIAGLLPAD